MHIVHLTPNFYPAVGGVETYVYELSKRLVERGNEVTVLTSDVLRFTRKKLKDFEIIDGIKVYRMPFQLILRNSFSIEATKKLIELDYDILHLHTMGYFLGIIPLLKLTNGCKVVFSTHGGIFHTKDAIILKKIYFNLIARLNLLFIDKILAHSKNDESVFSKISNIGKIIYSPYGIDWKDYAKLNPSHSNSMIYVGRFSKNKRLDRLINVLHHVRQHNKKVKLFLLGEDWDQKEMLIKVAERLKVKDAVKFVEAVPHKEVPKFLAKSGIFVLSSDYEGFGISVIEAMSVGLPVVANKIETMKEIINNGENGYIVNFEDYHKVSELVIKILENGTLQNRLSRNAKLSAKRFDWDKIVDEIENVYKC